MGHPVTHAMIDGHCPTPRAPPARRGAGIFCVCGRQGKQMGDLTTLIMTASVARRLGVTSARVHQLAASGALPVAARTAEGTRLYDAHAVEALAAERAARRQGAATAATAPRGG